MPANIKWKEMYRTELFELIEEGYPFAKDCPGADGSEELPIAGGRSKNIDEIKAEGIWKEAYYGLLDKKFASLPSNGYDEPNNFDEIISLAPAEPEFVKIQPSEYGDRVRGAWFGRCAAVILGKPLEVGYNRLQVEEYLRMANAYPLCDWVPHSAGDTVLRRDCIPSTKGNVQYVQSDDDIHYTICSLLLAEKHGEDFTLWDACMNLLDNITYEWVWTADRVLYYDLVNLDSSTPQLPYLQSLAERNPWRESMCPQLKSDFWGYITPGDLKRGAKLIHRLGSISATQNGLYGGMFIQGCTSAAMTQNPTIELIIAGGLSNIPKNSRLSEAVNRVVEWHKLGKGWQFVCDKIYEAYGHWYFAGAINNICFIVLALLEGGLDFERTITTAVMCGTDTDCNSANAGSIAGAAIGYDKLPQKWIAPLNDTVKSCVAGFGYGTISELCERTLRVSENIRTVK